jgi:hypothetical protein
VLPVLHALCYAANTFFVVLEFELRALHFLALYHLSHPPTHIVSSLLLAN